MWTAEEAEAKEKEEATFFASSDGREQRRRTVKGFSPLRGGGNAGKKEERKKTRRWLLLALERRGIRKRRDVSKFNVKAPKQIRKKKEIIHCKTCRGKKKTAELLEKKRPKAKQKERRDDDTSNLFCPSSAMSLPSLP